MFRCVAKVTSIAGVVALLCVPAAAQAQVQPYGYDNYGTFRNILPPGENGFDNAIQLAQFEATGQRPAHSSDQLAMYSNLTTAAGSITSATLPNYFKDATFGVPAGDAESTQTPEPGVTIVRDKQFGVPHIYGDTRSELMFGIGYATAEDRLFFIDALRHAGQGDLAAFAGGANVGMDETVWANEPYTQQDLVNQVNAIHDGPDGAQLYADAQSYINGINAYIAAAKQPLNTLSMMPAEYAAIGQPQGPAPFTLENLVSIATLVGGIFGNGGGRQLQNAMLYESMARRFGAERRNVAGSPLFVAAAHKHKRTRTRHRATRPAAHRRSAPAFTGRYDPQGAAARARRRGAAGTRARRKRARHHRTAADHSGYATFLSFDDPSDPEAPTTVHGTRFAYQTLPRPSRAVARTVALPDPGSVAFANPVAGGSVPQMRARAARTPGAKHAGLGLGALANAGPGLLGFPRSMSNALLVSARDSASGHPLAVMGPQVSYFTPEILMEEDIHGPGIDAEGAAFPGVNLYVELGHGPDYAWSATSAGQNIIDTFAVPLCNPSGGAVSTSSDYYELGGHCVAMETLTDQESWSPNLADQTPAGSVTFQTERTAYGLVTARATIHGRPVAYTNLRSTYMHELDSAAGFMQYNEPAQMRTPQDFFNAADKIGYTFNWFYTDNKNIAYFNSGQNPVRARHTDPLFPAWSRDAWPGMHPAAQMTPQSLTERDTPESAHPHVVNQQWLTSWNNKQAPGYKDAATGQEYASIYRSQLLDNNIAYYLHRDGGKLTLADLVNAMGVAGTQDLRGVEVLPYALKIIGKPTNPALATAVAELTAWWRSGAHRINRAQPGASGNYQQSDAVRIMDAWWPLWVQAEFAPVLGSSLLSQVESDFPINDEPGHGVTAAGSTSSSHLGSAFDVGFYGIVQKDLRAVLHQRVRGPLDRVFCGRGSLKACRAALEGSLAQAVSESPDQVYPGGHVCPAGDQMCHDSIQFRAIGAITQPLIEWVNRPTFQQAVEIQGHGAG
ncbi:MAG TPA: penicillin acylase family protein [Solirubrobacteraceae bacterium]|nr:penicillin acylase family protein [Solirubrobacteraceae bacterium]